MRARRARRAGAAGERAPGNPVQLAALHQAAIDADPRTRELQLLQAQTELRLRNIAAERLPSVAAEGLAQYQSDVPHAAGARARRRSRSSRRRRTPTTPTSGSISASSIRRVGRASRLERAQLAEAQARVRTRCSALRQEVNDAFFAAALLQERRRRARGDDRRSRRRGSAR